MEDEGPLHWSHAHFQFGFRGKRHHHTPHSAGLLVEVVIGFSQPLSLAAFSFGAAVIRQGTALRNRCEARSQGVEIGAHNVGFDRGMDKCGTEGLSAGLASPRGRTEKMPCSYVNVVA